MTAPLDALVVAGHLGLLGVWLGSMLYSLVIVQPRAARFFGADDDAHEAFLVTVGAGNRRPVLAILTVLGVSWALILAATGADAALLAAEGVALAAAAAVFAHVSWRLWPRRVFALPEERPAHRASLRRHASVMVALAAAAFLLAVLATF